MRSVERYPADLLQCLMEMSPTGNSHPTIALLTPGPFNSAFFEHVFLSQQMGIELVEGRDLVCVDRKLYMKDVHGLRQIDVLYRRIDDDFLDPLVFRPDSLLGVAGLTAVLRAGNAAIANGVGTGVADDKAVYAYTPAMIRYYLAEEPILPIVETFLLRDPEVREQVLKNLERYVVKPTGASGGYGVVIGPKASEEELAERANESSTIRRPSSRSPSSRSRCIRRSSTMALRAVCSYRRGTSTFGRSCCSAPNRACWPAA